MKKALNIFILLLTSCAGADESRFNRISYSVSSVLPLPLDTASRFAVEYLDAAGILRMDTGVHRFNFSFGVQGPGMARIRAVSADSVVLRAIVTLNGTVIDEDEGLEALAESAFE